MRVADNGLIEQNGPTWDALDALRANWTLADTKRTMQQVFGYFNSVGLTTVHSVLGSQDRGPAQYFGWAEQRPMQELKREGRLTLRLRLYFNTGPRVDGKPGNPELRDVLDNQWPDLGDDLVKTAGIGEHIVDWPLEGAVPLGDEYYRSVRLVAQHGWQLMEHSFNEPNHAARADVWERVNREVPITGLRWSIDHVNTIEAPTLRADEGARRRASAPTAGATSRARPARPGRRTGRCSPAASMWAPAWTARRRRRSTRGCTSTTW